ncbi:PAS domain S-box-containing protein [Methanomicrobium sp. W14]|uniref:PAS domain-containing sensor histidine kinase n=1 Tax=Methanomicrobium sp. W14 TaxID=2817839 RepID=UPI001AE43A44|nr:ATP-binding protein [Methanomicrobium sp. W14]MBP2134313.1 PAS domain S-box-containing protein [Methanomicrobium sp. W14]
MHKYTLSKAFENETFATYLSVAVVILLFLMMEITYQIIFENTIMVLSHIFYFPVIIISFLYPRRGVVISTVLSVLYLAFAYIFISPDIYGIVSATMQFYVYVSISVVVSVISDRLMSDRIKFRTLFDYSENGICVAEKDSGKIIEMNKKFSSLLDRWGFSESEKSIAELCGNMDSCDEFLSNFYERNSVENYEMKIRAKDGNDGYALVSASNIPGGKIVMTLTDITERKTDAEKIMSLNGELKTANDEANLYIDIMAHDINNANTAAQGFAELLGENITEDDRPYFDKMLAGIKQSSNIIDKVIKVREIHSIDNTPVVCSLDKSVDDAGKKLGIKVNYSPNGIYVMAGVFLCDLFCYIFENSLAFSKGNAVIDVNAAEKGELIEISVTDDGPGIPDSRKSTLFSRFQPENNSRKGRGLGLGLCWLIADAYGGKIEAKDAKEGDYKSGLKIIITLKKAVLV